MASADKAEHTVIYQSHVLSDYKVMQGGMPFMASVHNYLRVESSITCIVHYTKHMCRAQLTIIANS